MEKKVIYLLGTVGALAACAGTAEAASVALPLAPAASYADLLAPIPNALARIQNEPGVVGTQEAEAPPLVQDVQFFPHHHHHHRYRHRYHRRYHHHHHHHNY